MLQYNSDFVLQFSFHFIRGFPINDVCVGCVCVGVCVNGMNPSIIAKFILVLSMSLTYFCTTEVSGSSGIAFK